MKRVLAATGMIRTTIIAIVGGLAASLAGYYAVSLFAWWQEPERNGPVWQPVTMAPDWHVLFPMLMLTVPGSVTVGLCIGPVRRTRMKRKARP